MVTNRTPWSILLLPIWLLAVSVGAAIIIINCATHGMTGNGSLIFGFGWVLAVSVPPAVLFNAFDKERQKRRELERRWQKELEQRQHS